MMANEKRMIRADSLLEKIHETAEGLADCDQQNAAWALLKYAVRDIMDEETVDAVEVVHGRWILVDTEKGIGVCSNCNRQDRIDHLATHCRFCGAKMDLEVSDVKC